MQGQPNKQQGPDKLGPSGASNFVSLLKHEEGNFVKAYAADTEHARYSADQTARRSDKKDGFFKKLAEALKNIGLSVLYAPLLPFKGVMRKGLSRAYQEYRGYSSGKAKRLAKKLKFVKLVQEFHDVVVRKDKEGNLAPAVAAIIAAVIAFINGVMDRKRSGQPLSDIENIIAAGAETVEGEIENMKEEEIDRQVGGMIRETAAGFDIGMIAIFLLAGYLLMGAANKAKK